MTAVYIHIPYCLSKCDYCDFASAPIDDSVEAYLDALGLEMHAASKTASAVETLYIGGGTPTALTARQLVRLLNEAHGSFSFRPDAEITIEANPCSLTADKAEALTAGGVNRVSFGAQSFDDTELSLLGRRHKAGDIRHTFGLLRDAGVRNINIDLIYAIPGQSAQSWRASLAHAVELRPEHIAAYCLTFEPGTRFLSLLRAGTLQRTSEDEEAALSEIAHATLTDAGYEHYEISNFALPGRRSRHNLVYWSNEEYLGLGAGAVSYLDGKRISNMREARAYIHAMETRGGANCETERISPRMQAIETAIQRLRLSEGIDCIAFSGRFRKHPREVFGDSFQTLVELGLIEYDGHAIRSSLAGWRLANEVAMRLLP